MRVKTHNVPGLPDVYSISECSTGLGIRFFPKLHNRCMVKSDGAVAWFDTLDGAERAAVSFVSRMQS